MKPILFNTEMVRAILEGRKIVTRRVINRDMVTEEQRGDWTKRVSVCPYNVNDVLYVRETWREMITPIGVPKKYSYRADTDERAVGLFKWRPSIHMPKEAARLFLRVTDVRVERLHDMKLADFLAEGISLTRDELRDQNTALYNARNIFRDLWNSTLGKPYTPKRYSNSYYANPYVWVIEFEVISKEEALESV